MSNSMLFNPKNTMELSAKVVLHPSQLDNDIYNNLKENLSIRILNRCYKNFGLITKIYDIKEFKGGQIFNEDIEGKVQYDVKFDCEVIKPIEGMTMVTKIVSNTKSCLSCEMLGIITFIETNKFTSDFYINQYDGKIIYKKTGEALKNGDMVKVKILKYMFYNNKTSIVSLGFLESMMSEQEIKDYYEYIYDDEFKANETEEPKAILLSRISNSIKSVDDNNNEMVFNHDLTNLRLFKTDKKIEQSINKIIVINDLAEVADFINFLSLFSKMTDIKCVCVKPYINTKIKILISQMFKNIEFKFFQSLPLINNKGDERILFISDIFVDSKYLNELKPIKADLLLNSDILEYKKSQFMNGDLIIMPFTNKLRLYTSDWSTKEYDFGEYIVAYNNYFVNFNNPDKLFKDFYELFETYNFEPTFNNIMIYKIFRYYVKCLEIEESKEKTIEKVKNIIEFLTN